MSSSSRDRTAPGRRAFIAWAGASALAAAAPAWAADPFPTRPVKIVVPFPPGGTVDTLARILTPALGAQFGQPFVVENKGGANGTLGSKAVAQSAPDGYTLLLTASNQIINPLILRTVPYDAVKDFAPVSYIGYVPQLVVVRHDFPASNLQEFVRLAKKDPDTFTWATSGLGTAGHLAEELINQRAGIRARVVGYRGGGPALTDVIAGHVTAMVEPVPSAYPHVKSGRLKVLAVTSPKRASILPDVPTVAESGLDGFELPSWYGVWGPAGLPATIAERVSVELKRTLEDPVVKEKLATIAFEPIGGSPGELAAWVASESRKYAAVVKDAKIAID